MKLTKSQSHSCYLWMLAIAEIETASGERVYTYLGLCYLIDRLFDVKDDQLSILPELYDKSPIDKTKYPMGWYWYAADNSGWEKRIELLKQCIEETY